MEQRNHLKRKARLVLIPLYPNQDFIENGYKAVSISGILKKIDTKISRFCIYFLSIKTNGYKIVSILQKNRHLDTSTHACCSHTAAQTASTHPFRSSYVSKLFGQPIQHPLKLTFPTGPSMCPIPFMVLQRKPQLFHMFLEFYIGFI